MQIKAVAYDQNVQVLDDLLNQHNLQQGYEKLSTQYISFALFDKDLYLGGVTGKITGNTLHLSLLGIAAPFRRQGHAELLVKKVQQEAKKRECCYLSVSTQDYQGLSFYKKMGFTVFGQLEDCPFEGTTKYYLKKKIE